MNPKSTRPSSNKKIKKTGGMFSQFLEFFGMTPNVPSEYLTRHEQDEERDQIVWRCKSCHNPAKWNAKEERWFCPHHPQAEIVDRL